MAVSIVKKVRAFVRALAVRLDTFSKAGHRRIAARSEAARDMNRCCKGSRRGKNGRRGEPSTPTVSVWLSRRVDGADGNIGGTARESRWRTCLSPRAAGRAADGQLDRPKSAGTCWRRCRWAARCRGRHPCAHPGGRLFPSGSASSSRTNSTDSVWNSAACCGERGCIPTC